MVIFPFTRSCRIEKSKIKNFMGRFPFAVYLFPVIKRAEKVSAFVFFRKGRFK